jgi:hypothetical protein
MIANMVPDSLFWQMRIERPCGNPDWFWFTVERSPDKRVDLSIHWIDITGADENHIRFLELD